MENKRTSLIKTFAILGLLAAEAYMVLTVASPRLKGVEIPWDALAWRLVAMAVLFGPFGLAVGTGIGLLADALVRSVQARDSKKTEDTV